MEKQIINVGTLRSISNLNYSLSKELKILRNGYIHGEGRIPVWDLTNIIPKNVSIASLTAFLSISKVVRDFVGQPIEVMLLWQPDFQSFLLDIGFLQIARDFDLYNWNGMLGGFEGNKTSPHTKIFYYSDIPEIDPINQEEVIEWKDRKRQEIKHSIHFRLSNLFNNDIFYEQWNKNLEGIFNITISELVVNALLHGRAIAFVGVQRTRTGISTSVCDAGRGFLRSLIGNKNHLEAILEKSTLKALIYSSFQSKNKIGLYRAINDIIFSEGYVNISSYDGEILWKHDLWNSIKENDEESYMREFNLESHKNYVTGFTDTDILRQGYFKKYEDFLVGSRISFEIPF